MSAKKKRNKEEKSEVEEIPVDDILAVISGETLAEEKVRRIEEILKDLTKVNKQIKGAMLATMEGFPVATHPKKVFREDARISAAIAAIFATSERNALDLVNENIQYVAIKTSNRYILIRLAGEDYILAVITSEDAKLGIILRDLKEAGDKIRKII